MKSVVALPTKNEEKSVKPTIEGIRKLKLPVFVIDGKSTDRTVKIAKQMKIQVYSGEGKGKGKDMIKAIEIAEKLGFEIIVFTDCDSTYPIHRIPDLLALMENENCDMVVGARDFSSIDFVHRIGNIIHTIAINILFLANLKDINSGLRALKVSKFCNLLDAKGFDIEAQITTRALKKKYKIKEIDIDYGERLGEAKIVNSDGILILKRILKERFTK